MGSSSFRYKGKSIDAKEIGKELGVRYVLEGSVQRDQNRVRVNPPCSTRGLWPRLSSVVSNRRSPMRNRRCG